MSGGSGVADLAQKGFDVPRSALQKRGVDMFPAKNYKLVEKVKHGLDRDESPRRNFHPGTISLFLSPHTGPRTIITSFEI